MNNIINYNLFNLIGVINKDLIESSDIINRISEYEIDTLYILKRFGKEFGISKKYLFLKSIISYEGEKIYIKSKSIPYNKNISEEEIICTETQFIATNINSPEIKMFYDFKIRISEELPMYMQNMLGLLMKKIITNFKFFIENLNKNNINNINIINTINNNDNK